MAGSFLDLMRELGYQIGQRAQSTPVQSAPVQQAPPHYINRPDLRIRGNPDNPAQQTRQYAAPGLNGADVLAQQVMANMQQPPPPDYRLTRTPSSPAMNAQALLDRIRRETAPPFTPDYVRPSVVAPNAAAAYDPAPSGSGGEFTDEQIVDQFINSPAYQMMDPAQQANAIANLNREINPPTEETPPFLNQLGGFLGNVLGPAGKAIVDTPVLPGSLDPYHGGGAEPVTAGDIAREVYETPGVQKPLAAMAYPEKRVYENSIDAGIEYAATGHVPTWWQDFLYTDIKSAEGIPLVGRFLNNDNEFLSVASYLEEHPEERNTVNKIVADARAHDVDPNDAVGYWFLEKRGWLRDFIQRGIYDPVNLTAVLGVLGRTVYGVGVGLQEERGLARVANLVKGTGRVIEAPDLLVNEPWKLARDVIRDSSGAIKLGAKRLPGASHLRQGAEYVTAPSERAVHRAEVANVEDAIARGEMVPPQDLSQYPVDGRTDVPPPETPGGASLVPDEPPPQGPVTPATALTPEPAIRTEDEVRAAIPEMDSPGAVGADRPATQATNTAPRTIDTIYDGVIHDNDPLPANVDAAVQANKDILVDPQRTETEIPVQDVPLNSKIVATQRGIEPGTLQEYIDNPAIDSTADMPIAVKDGATYYVIEGTHRTGAARVRGDESITMRVIEASPAEVAPAADVFAPTLSEVYSDPGAPPVVPTERGPKAGWALATDSANPSELVLYKNQLASQYGERADAAVERIRAWTENVYEPQRNAANTMQWGKARMNRTLKPILDAELQVNYRAAARMEGIPTEGLRWHMNPELAVREPYDYEQLMYRVLHEPDAPSGFKRGGKATTVREEAERRGVISRDGKPRSNLPAEEATAAYWRFQQAEQLRPLISGSDAEFDEFLRSLGLDPAPVTAPETQLAAMPTGDDLRARSQIVTPGDVKPISQEYAAQIVDTVNQLSPPIKAAIEREVAPWAEVRFRQYETLPAPNKVLADLEYAGRMRVAALKTGEYRAVADLNPAAFPPARVGGDAPSRAIQNAILGDEATARAARSDLYRQRLIRSDPPPVHDGLSADYYAHKKAYELNRNIAGVRAMLTGEPDQAIRVADNFNRPILRADWEVRSDLPFVGTGNKERTGYRAFNTLTEQTSPVYAKAESAQAWIDRFPDTVDDAGGFMSAPECFL